MKRFQLLLAVAALAAACGGSTGTAARATTDDFKSNAPTFDKFAISQNDGDDAEPAAQAAPPSTSLTAQPPASAAGTVGGIECHPHLFLDTDEVIARVNFHFAKLVRHSEQLIESDPATATGNTRVFENVRGGLDRKLTITATANADGSTSYAFELELAAVAKTETFTQVMSGTIVHTGSPSAEVADAGATAAAVETKGEVTFDFDALHTVDATERARGQIAEQFDNLRDPAKGVKRTASITLTNFVPDDGRSIAQAPRNGTYHWEREPGVGGFFQFQDSLVLACPSNPAGAGADIAAVARWYRAADGSVHGRTDAQATGGQIPAGDKWEGVTCAQGGIASAPFEGEWLMKEEDATGASIFVSHVEVGVTPCDPAFGAVPDVNDSANDFDFSATVSFPNEF
jgi:hypothetical protein